ACTLVSARGRLMQALPAGGAMVSVQAREAGVLPLLAGHEREAAIAAVNGPDATVLSGDADTVLAIAEQLAAQGHRTKRLRVSHAFHSSHMDPMLAEFRRVLGGLTFHAPTLPVISNVTGQPATEEQLRSPGYWAEHV